MTGLDGEDTVRAAKAHPKSHLRHYRIKGNRQVVINKKTLALLAALSGSIIPLVANAADTPVSFKYKGYSAGLLAARMNAELDPRNDRFSLRMSAGHAGISSLFNWGATISASGIMKPAGVGPDVFNMTSTRKKKTDTRAISYTTNGASVTFSKDPGIPAHEKIAAGQTVGTVDPAAAFMAVLNYVDQTGRCDLSLQVFEGKSLYRFDVATLGAENLSDRNLAYKGRAVKCRIQPTPLAGKATRPNTKSRLTTVNMWVAKPVANGPMLPVKMTAKVQGINITLLMSSVR